MLDAAETLTVDAIFDSIHMFGLLSSHEFDEYMTNLLIGKII